MKKIISLLLVICMMLSIIPTAAAEESFIVNGHVVSASSYDNTKASEPSCSSYASGIIHVIYPDYPKNQTIFNNKYNILRGLTSEERKITEEHVREYIQRISPGARIRITHYSDETRNNYDHCNEGHTLVLVDKNDAAGTFTTLEAASGAGYSVTYSYRSFVEKWATHKSGYYYFFYIDDFGTSGTVLELTINPTAYPIGSLKRGSSFPLSGTIVSGNMITSVTGSIMDTNGYTVMSVTQNASTSCFNIRRSKVDMNLKFSSLDDGYYYLVYEAEDSSGRTALWQSATFTVGNPEVPHTEHIKGEFVEYGAEHPHMDYYICSVCGEKFTDGATTCVDTCEVCNPTPSETPKIPTTSESPETSATPRGHWSEWSEWSTTAVSASETRQVEPRQVTTQEARAEYRYGRYVASGHDCWCATYLEKLPYVSGKATLDYTGWSTTRYSANSKGWSCGNCSGTHIGVDHTTSDGRAWWKEFVISGSSYYWEESRVVPTQYQTQYRYRDWISE